MGLVKFLSSEKLVEYLDEELRLFLNAQEIYEINQYGWLPDDRPDPEYIGLAMWQTDPPGSLNKISDITVIPATPVTSPTDMGRIFTTGIEFEELMKSARHSIGLTHLYSKDPDGISQCYGYHLSDTVMKLSRATDRLRDFFIDACSALKEFDLKDQYSPAPSSLGEQRHIFCRPFEQIRDLLAENPEYYEELFDCTEDLIPLVEQASVYRITGHEGNSECFFSENIFSIASDNISQRRDHSGQPNSGRDLETATHNISEWYKLLVNTSNGIFLAEYLIRNSCKNAPITNIAISN